MAESATVQCHHSAEPQTERVPTHSFSTHTAAVADNTGKRGYVRGSTRPLNRSWDLNSVSERRTGIRLYSGRYCTVFTSEVRSTCVVFVCVSIDYKSYMTFVWIRLVTYIQVFWTNFVVVAETVGPDSSKEQKLNDWWRWWHDKACSIHNTRGPSTIFATAYA